MEKRHGDVYCCKRLRLLEALLEAGFEPYSVVPDAQNWKYKNWLFHNDENLEKFLDSYFKK